MKRGPARLKRLIVLAALPAGVILALAAAGCRGREQGAPSAEAPLDHSKQSPPPSSLPFTSLSFDEALVRARAEKKLVFVDVTADWCGWCTRMDEDVFSNPRVQQALLEYVPIKMDADRGGRKTAVRYRVTGLPAFLVVNGDGEVVGRFDGYMSADAFLERLGRSSGARG